MSLICSGSNRSLLQQQMLLLHLCTCVSIQLKWWLILTSRPCRRSVWMVRTVPDQGDEGEVEKECQFSKICFFYIGHIIEFIKFNHKGDSTHMNRWTLGYYYEPLLHNILHDKWLKEKPAEHKQPLICHVADWPDRTCPVKVQHSSLLAFKSSVSFVCKQVSWPKLDR